MELYLSAHVSYNVLYEKLIFLVVQCETYLRVLEFYNFVFIETEFTNQFKLETPVSYTIFILLPNCIYFEN